MKTTDWDKLASSSPIDRLAALSSIFGCSTNRSTTEEEILLSAQRKLSESVRGQKDFTNFVGTRSGGMTIVAYLGGRSPFRDASRGSDTGTKVARWLARCSCGRYTVMKTQAVKRGAVRFCKPCYDKRSHAWRASAAVGKQDVGL